jgi:hypothetical protein
LDPLNELFPQDLAAGLQLDLQAGHASTAHSEHGRAAVDRTDSRAPSGLEAPNHLLDGALGFPTLIEIFDVPLHFYHCTIRTVSTDLPGQQYRHTNG